MNNLTQGLPEWSSRRKRIFERCPREYFLHYEAARGGHEDFADVNVRLVHRLKNLLPAQYVFPLLLNRALRDMFYNTALDEEETDEGDAGAEESVEKYAAGRSLPVLFREVAKRVWRSYLFAKDDMLTGAASADHGKLMFEELYYECEPLHAVFERAENSLRKGLDVLLKCGVPDFLVSVPSESRRFIESPCPVEYNGCRMWFSPIVNYREEGGILSYFLHCGFTDEELLIALYHGCFVRHCDPAKVRIYYFDAAGKPAVKIADTSIITAAKRSIRSSLEKILSYDFYNVFAEKMPEKHCSVCRFRKICKKK